jgi:hypothetical protein
MDIPSIFNIGIRSLLTKPTMKYTLYPFVHFAIFILKTRVFLHEVAGVRGNHEIIQKSIIQ